MKSWVKLCGEHHSENCSVLSKTPSTRPDIQSNRPHKASGSLSIPKYPRVPTIGEKTKPDIYRLISLYVHYTWGPQVQISDVSGKTGSFNNSNCMIVLQRFHDSGNPQRIDLKGLTTKKITRPIELYLHNYGGTPWKSEGFWCMVHSVYTCHTCRDASPRISCWTVKSCKMFC